MDGIKAIQTGEHLASKSPRADRR